MMRTFASRSIGSLLLVICFCSATERLRQWLNPSVIAVLRLLLIALFPIVVGGMVMTGRFVVALNPLAVIGTIARLPTGYAVLIVVLCAIWAAPLWLLHTNALSLSLLWRPESFLPMQIF